MSFKEECGKLIIRVEKLSLQNSCLEQRIKDLESENIALKQDVNDLVEENDRITVIMATAEVIGNTAKLAKSMALASISDLVAEKIAGDLKEPDIDDPGVMMITSSLYSEKCERKLVTGTVDRGERG